MSINLLIRKSHEIEKDTRIYYARMGEYWTKEQKYDSLDAKKDISRIVWDEITPDKKFTWLTKGLDTGFDSLIPLGTRTISNNEIKPSIFDCYGIGLQTARDYWVYSFQIRNLIKIVKTFITNYNSEVDKWKNRSDKKASLEQIINFDETRVKWSSKLVQKIRSFQKAEFDQIKIAKSLYRPFTKQFLFFDDILIHRLSSWDSFFPTNCGQIDNQVICSTLPGSKKFDVFISNLIMDYNFFSGGSPIQGFPFYTYSKLGNQRKDNITDWSLMAFQNHYSDHSINKWDVFYFVYGLLNHLGYREKYAANLRRELPRIPFAPDFWAFSKAGKRLAEIHVDYEDQPEYPLTMVENPNHPLDWRVEKMKLSPDKTAIIYNDFLTLTGIPPEVYEYKLGNRSALEWIIDQYRVKTDKRSGIVNDPNNPDDPDYIVRLIKKIVTVSLETVQIVKGLPKEFE